MVITLFPLGLPTTCPPSSTTCTRSSPPSRTADSDQLLCSLVAFRDAELRPLALVYFYERGTFYPFAPLPGERRDNPLELQVKATVKDDLRIEQDLTRWFPLWGAPGL